MAAAERMTWVRKWTLRAPGWTADTIGFDDRSASLLIADGWGVTFSALEVRRVDARSGRVLGSVRTRTSIRAFGRAIAGDDVFFVGDKKLFLHDATTLERRSVYDHRVPRYCNAICDLGDGTVALAAPNALVEYDCRVGAARRVSKSAPVIARGALTLGRIDERVLCLLADGTVMLRAEKWEALGKFHGPHHTGAMDEGTGLVVALAGERASPYDENGNPQSVAWPRSRTLTMATLRGPWTTRELELPFPAFMVGVVRGEAVAVGAFAGGETEVACVDLHAPDRPITVGQLPGRFFAFAGPSGIVTSAGSQGRDFHELSMFERP
jgi:hypothetical protein